MRPPLRGEVWLVDLGLAAKVRPGGFDAQGILTIPNAKLIRHLGTLSVPQMNAVELAVIRWLGLQNAAAGTGPL